MSDEEPRRDYPDYSHQNLRNGPLPEAEHSDGGGPKDHLTERDEDWRSEPPVHKEGFELRQYKKELSTNIGAAAIVLAVLIGAISNPALGLLVLVVGIVIAVKTAPFE